MSGNARELGADLDSRPKARAWISRSQPGNGPYRPSGAPHQAVTAESSPIAIPVAMVMDEVEATFLKKHQDYGPDGIATSPFGVLEGILTRMHDKHHRAINLVKRGHGGNYEPLEDCFRDLIGYSLAAMLYLQGQWPGAPTR